MPSRTPSDWLSKRVSPISPSTRFSALMCKINFGLRNGSLVFYSTPAKVAWMVGKHELFNDFESAINQVSKAAATIEIFCREKHIRVNQIFVMIIEWSVPFYGLAWAVPLRTTFQVRASRKLLKILDEVFIHLKLTFNITVDTTVTVKLSLPIQFTMIARIRKTKPS